MRQNLIAQSVQLLKHLLCDTQLSIVMGKNWALSVDQCWLQVWQLLVHVINFLNILLRCNGFATIQKAVVDQMGSRPPVTMTFFWYKFGFGAAFLGPATELVVASCRIKFTFCLTSQSD